MCRRCSERLRRPPPRPPSPGRGTGSPAPALAVGLRYLPVLAVRAVEVAALRRNRVGVAAGQEVEERLLLYRLGLRDDGLAVDRCRGCHPGSGEHRRCRSGSVSGRSDGRTRRSERSRRDWIVERLAQHGQPDVRHGFVRRTEVPGRRPCGGSSPGSSPNRRRWPGIGIERDGWRPGERLVPVRERVSSLMKALRVRSGRPS